jgi:hypothetical protein
MGLAKDLGVLFRNWNDLESNLENEVLFYDFFRREEGYDPSRPLILCKNHGLLALYRMDGLDPEPLGEEGIEMAANAVRRAMDAFNPENQDGEFRGGTWEVQNIFQRRRGLPPTLTTPSRDSAALRFLCESTADYWARRVIYQEEIIWAIHFIPRSRENDRWRLRNATQAALIRLEELRAQARFVRRVLKTFEENLLAFQTARPRMGFGLHMLDEEACHQVLYRLTNRVDTEPPQLDSRLPLVTQACASHRDSSDRVYRINDRPTKVLTWKVPPRISVGYVFRRFQDELGFPFTITQTWRSLEFARMAGRIELFQGFAGALASRQRDAAEYEAEAKHFLGTIRTEGATPFNWYFNLLVDGESLTELEDRAAKVQTQMKMIFGADCQEEGPRHRVFADLGSIPGNGSYCQRFNLVTSLNVGDSAFLFRLGAGDRKPFMILGDRKGGVYSYSLFTPHEPSWNKAVLGLPGSGKSLLMNMFLVGNAMFPSQGYVLDKGNSYGPIFELMAQEMPGEVAVMRIRGGQFQFNPCPLAWALQEKERQEREGIYKRELPEGGYLPCPVEQAKLFFEAWLDALVGQGRALEPAQKNLLDRALKGGEASGRGGFFRDFENQCRQYLRALEKDPASKLPSPRPLTSLLTFLRAEAPQFVDSVELWTRAPRDQFFDSGVDTVSSAKYVYFELEGIEDDPLLARPFVSALMGVIWNRIINPSTLHERKIVIIDEAWAFLADPSFFAVVEMMFRTIRKFNGFVVLSTQTPNDIKNGEARKLLQTMAEQFLYKGFSEPTYFSVDLGLSEHQKRLFETLQQDERRREVFYWSRRGLTRVLNVEIAPTAYWFATTDAEDKALRTAFFRKFGMVEGTRHLVEACEGRTIPGKELRLRKVQDYAQERGIA